MGDDISTSDVDMAALDRRNAQADHIIWAARLVLWVLTGPLTPQREVVTCCYLLHQLLGPLCPLIETLFSQVFDAIDKDFYSLTLKMEMIHHCTVFAKNVLCIIGNYLNACVKASSTASVSESGGKIPIYFQYKREKRSHGQYVFRPLPPSLQTLLLTHDSERAVTARRAWDPAPSPAIGGLVRPGPGVGQGGSAGGSGW